MQIEESWPVCNCGNEFPPGRKSLGYTTCLECGNIKAQVEIKRKKESLVPSGPKQGPTYISEAARREHVLGVNKYRRTFKD